MASRKVPHKYTVAAPEGSLGAELRRLRAEAGWNQTEVAERAELHQSQVSAYEIGKVGFPAPATLRRLSVAFGKDENYLLPFTYPANARKQTVRPGDTVYRYLSAAQRDAIDAVLSLEDRELPRIVRLVQAIIGGRDTEVSQNRRRLAKPKTIVADGEGGPAEAGIAGDR